MMNCVISAVGKNSLHREWMKGAHCEFDLHLIVYDDSLERYAGDADFICAIKGYKLKVVHEYLTLHPDVLEKYDYFFIPDDDIRMDALTINKLFSAMRSFHLQIAQPALVDSYYLWGHTLGDPYCRLRYTNYVEMMVPCFSRDALRQVLFTFNENTTGWGTETHWPLLIGAGVRDMAILDSIEVVHTRPIQSGQRLHRMEAAAYLAKYGLETHVYEYGYLPSGNAGLYLCERSVFRRMAETIGRTLQAPMNFREVGMCGWHGYAYMLSLYGLLTQSRRHKDRALQVLAHVQGGLNCIKDDLAFSHGITGCGWLIEFLSRNGLLRENSSEKLEELDAHVDAYVDKHLCEMSPEELVGIGKYWLAKVENGAGGLRLDRCKTVAARLKVLDLPSCLDDAHLLDAILLLGACGEDVQGWASILRNRMTEPGKNVVSQLYVSYALYRLMGDANCYAQSRMLVSQMDIGKLSLWDSCEFLRLIYEDMKFIDESKK